MKNKLKKMFVSCFLSIVCGAICGKVVYGIYDKELENDFYGEKIYLIQAGAYSDYDNMIKNTSFHNYVYYEDDDGLFKSIIGFTENYDNIDKIKKIYPDEVVINEYYSSDVELNKKIREFDRKMNGTTNDEEIKEIVLEMLNLYKDKDGTLIQITS